MTYCQECGLQVAENDTFCPYCGITIPQRAQETDVAPQPAVIDEPIPAPVETQEAQKVVNSFQIEGKDLEIEKELQTPKVSDYAAQSIADENTLVSIGGIVEESKPQEAVVPNASQESAKSVISSPPIVEEKPKNIFSDNPRNIEGHPPVINSIPKPAKSFSQDYISSDLSSTIPYIPKNISKSLESVEEKKEETPRLIGIENQQTPAPESEPIADAQIEKENLPIEKPPSSAELPHAPVFHKPLEEVPSKEEVPVFISIQPNDLLCQDTTKKGRESEVKSSAEAKGEKEKAPQSMTSPNLALGDTDGKRTGKLKSLTEGTVVNDRYEIIRKIGGGGMGAVYLASDKNLGGVLRAVKEMIQSYIEESQQEKAINDFRRESMILSTLDHPSIPTIYDYFYDEKESRFYLVMKYINGGDLSARLRSAPEGKLDEETVVDWAIQLADVLDYLHNRPATVIYRDLKPSNVMIDGNTGRVMLIDFGIARSVKKEEKGVTAVGTMGYAPPELFSGNVEPRSDIYSLGSTMFHLLTGADPQTNPLLIFDFNKNPRPRQINPRLSDQIEKILMKTVEYNTAQRFESAATLREALKKHLEDLRSGNVTFGVSQIAQVAAMPNNPLPVFCGFCGQRILAADTFCPFCGAKQPLADEQMAGGVVRPKTGKLVIIGATAADSSEFTLEKESNMLGRRDPVSNIFPEVDLSKFDPQTKISRRHARIRRERESFILEDLGSSNGTIIINRQSETMRLLPKQQHTLTNGDKIKLGDTVLQFSVI